MENVNHALRRHGGNYCARDSYGLKERHHPVQNWPKVFQMYFISDYYFTVTASTTLVL